MKTMGDIDGFDPSNLASAGWGVIFHGATDTAVKEALAPLLASRRQAAGERFKHLTYLPGELKIDFLLRHGIGPGPIVREQVPYYLLIVGDPSSIPFHFQYQLSFSYAVGRLCLESPDAYACYAQTVIEWERRIRSTPRAVVFGVRNDDDRLTELSMEHLLEPLTVNFAERPEGWEVETILGAEATKVRLADVLSARAPDLFFASCHGAHFPKGHALQQRHQGALMCADWPGPQSWRKGIPESFYYSGDDLGAEIDLRGLIAVLFTCYSAGTPRMEAVSTPENPRQVALADFVARLPQRMLGREHGALAVIGSVDTTHDENFLWEKHVLVRVFELMLRRIMRGERVGLALEPLSRCAAELATELLTAGFEHGVEMEDEQQVHTRLWRAYQDTRGYIVLGDPAVRLNVSGTSSV